MLLLQLLLEDMAHCFSLPVQTINQTYNLVLVNHK